MTVSVLDPLDDLATRPYLALAALVLAALALAAVVVLMLRTGTLRRRLRALEQGADGTTAADDATRASAGTARRAAARATTGTATGAVPVEPVLRRTASSPHVGPTADHDATAALDGTAEDGDDLHGGTLRDGALHDGDLHGGAPHGGAPRDGVQPDGALRDGDPHDGGAPRWPAHTPAAGADDTAAGSGAAAARSAGGGDAVQLAATAALREVTLLGRQLELLDGLEQREEAPEVLAVLFQLDNLTMRLRRQAESVLVLAGRESGRRARDPLSVADVVRTACAQIDGYERVAVDPATDAELGPAAVVPMAHLVAELLENALRFSDPATQVDVRIDAADDGGATIAITDAGLGMDDATLADARARLDAGTATPGGGRIGLAVVGRLARRHGVTVHLDPGARGTTATVHVPARLLTGGAPATWSAAGTARTTGATRLGELGDPAGQGGPGGPADPGDPAHLGGPADLGGSTSLGGAASPGDAVDPGLAGPGPTDPSGPTDGSGPSGPSVLAGATVPAASPFGGWDGLTEPPVLPQEEFAPSLAVDDAPLTRRSVRAPAPAEPAPTRDTPVVGFAATGGAHAQGSSAPVDGTVDAAAQPGPTSPGLAPALPEVPWVRMSDGPAPVPEWPAMTPDPLGPPGTSAPATGFAPGTPGGGSAAFGSGTGFAPAASVSAPAQAASVPGGTPAGPATASAPAAPGTGFVPAAPGTGFVPAAPGTGFVPAAPGTDFAPAAPGTDFAPAAPGTGLAPAASATGVGAAAPAPGSGSPAPTTGSGPAAPTTGFAPAPVTADGWFVPAGGATVATPGDAGLRDEVLAELGRLSGYSPARAAPSEPAPALERRTATTVVEPLAANRGPVDRDAGTVRRRFAAFQSATGRSRGRQR